MATLVVMIRLGASASAADSKDVEALIRQGVELRQNGHDERALPLFQQAYAEGRTPRSAGQLGLCEVAVGYWLDAEKHLSEALSSLDHPWVAKNVDSLNRALTVVRKNITDVTIEGTPAGAEIFVNGIRAGSLPLVAPLRLAKGPADIELRAAGFVTASRSLRLRGGDSETVKLALTRQPEPSRPLEPEAPSVAVVPSPANPASPATDLHGPTPKRIAAWSTAAGAGLGLAFGVVETAVWIDKHHAFDDHVGPLASDPSVTGMNCGSADANYGGSGCSSLHSELDRARLLAIVGYGVAGALAVTSSILFLESSDVSTPSGTTALSCTPDPSSRGASCWWSF